MKAEKDILVSVNVLTYNQEHWIRQTLLSILSQETKYSFEIIIGEDCSTDGTRIICQEFEKKYSNVKIAPQNKNLGLIGNYVNCIKHSKGKYLMWCAGDDFWHNPSKIQLQIDFMETHPECILCHTDIDTLFMQDGHVEHNTKQLHGIHPPEGKIQNYILAGKESVTAATLCVRKSEFDKYIPLDKYLELEFPREDWPTLLILSAYGNVNYLPISTATYRKGQPSITNELSYDKIVKRYKQDKIMTEYLYSLFPCFGVFKDSQFFDQYQYFALLRAAYQNNDYKHAKQFAIEIGKTQFGHNHMTKMTKTWFTFQLYRILKFYISQYLHR